MAETKKRLGRGLDSLLSSTRIVDLQSNTLSQSDISPSQASRDYVVDLPFDSITTNPHQPRQSWDHDKLAELADSIATTGLIQPVIVRSLGDSYQLIAGERRFRASQMAGTQTIPAIVRDASEDQMLEWALVENIHRDDLNPIERARAYQQFINRFALSQEQAASRLGEDRSTIANYMRLLELSDDIRAMVVDGKLSMGHARALLALPDEAQRYNLAQIIVGHNLSVRQVEQRIQAMRKAPASPAPAADPHIAELEEQLSQNVGTKVVIRTVGRKRHRGKIIIEFNSLDDFDRIRDRLKQEAEPSK